MAEEATNIYDHGNAELEFREESLTKLARTVLLRYREAVMWAASERVGQYSLSTTLSNCYEQFNGILSADDAEVIQTLGVGAYMNITSMKVDVVQSFLRESIIQDEILPWVIQPTPLPELSAQGRLQALELLKQELFTNNSIITSGVGLEEIARQVKSTVKRQETEVAKRKVDNMTQLMKDQIVEGGWRSAVRSFITDVCVYPFGVLHGPLPARSARMVWSGNTPQIVYEKHYKFECVSPWDFWYSPDSQDTQNGSGIFIRQRWTKQNLLNARALPSYNTTAIDQILLDIESDKDTYNFHWMSANPDQPDQAHAIWSSCSGTIDTMIHYGVFSGAELEEHHVTGLDPNQFYDACITLLGGHIIQIAVTKNPHVYKRPVFTASFYKHRERIPNEGIAQRLRDVERCFIYNLRCLMRNAQTASEPMMEMDYQRVMKHMAPQDIAQPVPGMVLLTDSDINTNTPAVRPILMPEHMASYVGLMDRFMEYAHLFTNIPAALHGIAVGSGANRTFRGISLLQNNAMQSIQSAVANMDEGAFSKIGALLYDYNMLHSTDPEVKGDAKVYAQGVEGLLQKAMERQNAMEVLEFAGPLVANLGGIMDMQPLLIYAIQDIFRKMNIPEHAIPKPLAQAPTAEAVPSTVGGEEIPQSAEMQMGALPSA